MPLAMDAAIESLCIKLTEVSFKPERAVNRPSQRRSFAVTCFSLILPLEVSALTIEPAASLQINASIYRIAIYIRAAYGIRTNRAVESF